MRRKLRNVALFYLCFGLILGSIYSYWDYHGISSGEKFHQLSFSDRNLVRATLVTAALFNPTSEVTTRLFVGGKPRNHENARLFIAYTLSLIPSFLVWIYLLKGKRGLNAIFRKKFE